MGRGPVGLGGVVLLSPPGPPAPPALPGAVLLDAITVYVVVHPVDTQAHPTLTPGFRWAVMLGPCPPADVSRCANAGWCPNEREALDEGTQNGNSALAALRLVGLNVAAAPNVLGLDYDPIPAGGDPVRVL